MKRAKPKKTDQTKLKLIIVGEEGSGKSQLFLRQIAGDKFNFSEEHTSTIGLDPGNFTNEENSTITTVFDASGKPVFYAIVRSYFYSADILMIACDLTKSNQENIKIIDSYLEDKQIKARDSAPIIIVVGTKADLLEKQDEERLNTFEKTLEKRNLKFVKTSAKTGENVAEAFQAAIDMALEKNSEAKLKERKEMILKALNANKDRIDSYRNTKRKLKHGFWLLSGTREKNREKNYKVTAKLISEVNSATSLTQISTLFSSEHIHELRGKGTVRGELKNIIKQVRTSKEEIKLIKSKRFVK